jgi:hypothetical protein
MAENIPPGSKDVSSADSTRGLPYYEKLKRDLRETLQKKRMLDKTMVSLSLHGASKPLLIMRRRLWNNRYTAWKNPISKKRRQGISSRGLTTTSKARLRREQ